MGVQFSSFINMSGITGVECIDEQTIFNLYYGIALPPVYVTIVNDTTCEIFWKITVNNQVISQHRDSDPKKEITTGSSIEINPNGVQTDTNTISVPILPNTCINFLVEAWEKDGDNNINTSDDDRMVRSASVCSDDFSNYSLSSVFTLQHSSIVQAGAYTTREEVNIHLPVTITATP